MANPKYQRVRSGYTPRSHPFSGAGVAHPLASVKVPRCAGCQRRLRNSLTGWRFHNDRLTCPTCTVTESTQDAAS
ncbi:hypothetical protein [Rhodococcoides kroppenstedtii]|uniref:hypothetical protein n=1 Tax=Rhodococcoides kroppenstedtii TaxID=293050 RepID=UPI0029541CFF|nr:hypothetical protein [Rhodococcus kroppenstedtii]